MPFILGFVGLVLGALFGKFWGAVVLCGAGVWLGIWINRNDADRARRRGDAAPAAPRPLAAPSDRPPLDDFDALRDEVLALRRRVDHLEGRAGIAQQLAAPPTEISIPAAEPAPAVVARSPEIRSAPVVEPVQPVATPSPVAPTEPNKLWQWLSGGNAMVRIGVVVLFFGVAFLMKYAAEHVHVPIELRLTGVAIAAIVMLVLGWRLRERAGGYGLVLQGGGVGVLYLVVFGAFRIWKLVPPELAFVLLVAIALASAILAIAQDSRALAIAGISGGFLAPLLASTGQGSHVMLFGFYLVLDIGVLVIAWYKAWRGLNLLSFAFTFGIGAIWGAEAYRPEHFATTEPFLVAFFLLYVAIAVLYALRRAPSLKDPVDNILVFGNPLVAAGLQFGLVKEIEYGAAWSAVALGAFYCVLAHQLWRRQRESLQLLVECFVALGLAFATLAIPLAFDGRWTAASWALEGAAALWVGTRQNRRLPRWLGLALQPAAGIAFLADAQGYVAALAVLNSGFIGGMTIALSGWFCSWYLERNRTSDTPNVLAALLLVWGTAWWLGTGWYE